MATYSTTDNKSRYSTSQIDARIKKAKTQKKEELIYAPFCESCGKSDSRLTMSHIVSVKFAKENGMAELCWDLKNILLECETCHTETENQSSAERVQKYLKNKYGSI